MTRNNIMQEVVTQRRSSDDGVTPITPAGVQDELLIDQKSHALQNLTQSYGGYTMIYYDILWYTQGNAAAFTNRLDALSSNGLYMSKSNQT